MKNKCFCYSDKGGRDNNEDSYVVLNGTERNLYLVADGLGGHECGEVASQIAVSVIGSCFADAKREFNIVEAVNQANDEIVKEQEKTGKQMKTTIAGVFTINNKSYAVNVGDSRVYLFKNGKIVYQSLDHSVPQIEVLRGKITSDEIRNHKDRSKLCMVLGDSEPIDPAVEEFDTDSFDAALVVSDGFWEFVFEREMEEMLAVSDTPEDWISKMKEILNTRIDKENDNNTAIAVMYIER